MAIETVSEKGLVLLGCGKMGSAMLQGWIEQREDLADDDADDDAGGEVLRRRLGRLRDPPPEDAYFF